MDENDRDERVCEVCGCTDETPCPGGCDWVPDPFEVGGHLCSRCRYFPGY